MPTGIELIDVSKRFGNLQALTTTNLRVEPGQIVTLLGPSGCGKTTLLRMIAGLEQPTSGTLTIDEGAPNQARRTKRIGLVPQQPGLLPWRTVESNARLLIELNKQPAQGSGDTVQALLNQVGLGEFRDALPHQLSGGMQQRVALVRAFALGAPYLLLDEPFAALDEITRADMRHLLGELCETSQTTVVFVTHSIAEAVFLSDRVLVMSPRPGRIVGDVPVDLERPRRAEIEDTTDFFKYETTLRSLLRGAHPDRDIGQSGGESAGASR